MKYVTRDKSADRAILCAFIINFICLNCFHAPLKCYTQAVHDNFMALLRREVKQNHTIQVEMCYAYKRNSPCDLRMIFCEFSLNVFVVVVVAVFMCLHGILCSFAYIYQYLHAGDERIALLEYVEPYTVEPRPAVVYTAFCIMNARRNKKPKNKYLVFAIRLAI